MYPTYAVTQGWPILKRAAYATGEDLVRAQLEFYTKPSQGEECAKRWRRVREMEKRWHRAKEDLDLAK